MAVKGVLLSAGDLAVTIAVPDAAAAADFYRRAFGAEELARYVVPGHPAGVGPVKAVHLRIGGAAICVSTANPRTPETMDRWGARTPAMLQGFSTVVTLFVDDVDAALARAAAAGALPRGAAQDAFWGDRIAVVEDPFGHAWGLAATVEEVTVEEHNRRWADFVRQRGEAGAAPYLELPRP
jgi:PhnB protein